MSSVALAELEVTSDSVIMMSHYYLDVRESRFLTESLSYKV